MFVALAAQIQPEIPAHPRQVNAYDKFMAGYDTAQIAELWHVSEPVALRWISQERSRRHEIASPYGRP